MSERKDILLVSIVAIVTILMCNACNWNVTIEECDGYNLVVQDGATLGYSPESGVELIYDDGYAFKDLNHNKLLDKYEDWRLTPEVRAKDLAGKMRLAEIAGLMLYSNHQAIPNANGYTPATWGGKSYAESGAKPWDLTDQQKEFMEKDKVRHILITSVESPEVAARWNNAAQAFAESLRLGIPANNSSDPRHSADNDAEFKAGGGGQISMWPNELGMGATFDPSLMFRFGTIASAEYRALGFTTCLSPQADLATDPRWMRFNGTYGEDPELVKDMITAYCEAFQTTGGADDSEQAWGKRSVNVMVKHWPGGGTGEAGRDAHFGRGKYGVYPNNNIDQHKYPFIEGAFNLKNGTKKAAAVMPYYTISHKQSSVDIANNFNKEIIEDQLRNATDYDGVICTDWGVTADEYHPGIHSGKPWGIEEFSVAERHYMAILAGVDQFGGNNDAEPVLEAFEMIKKMYGDSQMQERVRKSAERLLLNIFRTGLFENPYLDPNSAKEIVGNPAYMQIGYEAQVKSVVMLKNKNKTLPSNNETKKMKVYVPQRHVPRHANFFGGYTEEQTINPVTDQMLEQFYQRAILPEKADFAIVFIESPMSGWGYKTSETLADTLLANKALRTMQKNEEYAKQPGFLINFAYSEDDIYFIPNKSAVTAPDNGYYPISLQYNDYVATEARATSLAGGDPYEKSNNRSYKGKGVRTINKEDMLLVQETKKNMGDKPVIVVVDCKNPFVLSEIEPYADAILLTFSVQNQAVLDIIKGNYEPSGLLPFQMPLNMSTVERQAEDTPHDMECYKDAEGNIYDFAFGMNWNGKIDDERVKKYAKHEDKN